MALRWLLVPYKPNRRTNILHCSDKQRVLFEKFALSLPMITRCEIGCCGKITDSFFCLCLLMLFPCTWWLTTKDSPDKCNTSWGINFQNGNNSFNLSCLYKSQEMMMTDIHFTVLPVDCAWYMIVKTEKNHISLVRVHVNWIIQKRM